MAFKSVFKFFQNRLYFRCTHFQRFQGPLGTATIYNTKMNFVLALDKQR